MILLWGLHEDRPLAAVLFALSKSGTPTVFIDQKMARGAVVWPASEEKLGGTIFWDSVRVALADVSAAYLRPYDAQPDDAALVLMAWADVAEAAIVNRPTAMAPNASKPFQAAQIEEFGFRTPDTLISTDSAAVIDFWARHGEIVYKSISGMRSIVSRLQTDQVARLENLRWCPTQFQEYVPGIDYRVHVVGDDAFSCRIESQADDYRYGHRHGSMTHIFSTRLPADLESAVVQMVRGMNLLVAGVDLRLTPTGDWYCFEVNPSPAFTYFSDATDQPIAEAIASLLSQAHLA
jgi:glutathione synthase/RimK-type ligase-like ATP-grasp enzyme